MHFSTTYNTTSTVSSSLSKIAFLNAISDPFFTSDFTGKERDEETGYGYFGARYYDADLMTMWLSVDPMADKYPSISPYDYCAWNPVKLVDPDGRMLDDYTAKLDGTIEKKKTNDKFDRFFVEKSAGQVEQVAQIDKVTATDGVTTLVKFPDKGTGFCRYGDVDKGGDHYVQPIVAAALFGAIYAIHSQDPTITIQFGDMSGEKGNKPGTAHTGGTASHVNGRNVDLRYVRTDRERLGVTVDDPTFDWIANQTVVDAFKLFGFSDIKSFPTQNGRQLEHTKKLEGHHHHMHLQGFTKKPTSIN